MVSCKPSQYCWAEQCSSRAQRKAAALVGTAVLLFCWFGSVDVFHLQFDSTADKRVVCITVCTVEAVDLEDASEVSALCNVQVKPMPVTRPWVSPGDFVTGFGLKV